MPRGRISDFPDPSRTPAARSAECLTPQRVRSHNPPQNIPGRLSTCHRCGLGQAALRVSRTAECPTPQRVRSHNPPQNIPERLSRCRRCGLGQAALRFHRKAIRGAPPQMPGRRPAFRRRVQSLGAVSRSSLPCRRGESQMSLAWRAALLLRCGPDKRPTTAPPPHQFRNDVWPEGFKSGVSRPFLLFPHFALGCRMAKRSGISKRPFAGVRVREPRICRDALRRHRHSVHQSSRT